MTAAESYARWVLSPSNADENGRLVKLAAERFLNDLKRDDIYFDEAEGSHMLNFGERYCYQWEDAWEGIPIKWEHWQWFVFQQVFGWIRKDTGTRRFNEVFVEMAKKQGKSTMVAVLGIFHTTADRINTPKVFTAANNEDQAKICVNMAGRIIEASPDLQDLVADGTIRLFNYKDNITEIVNTEKNGFIKAFSKETSDKKSKTSGGKHGVNASLGIVDEFSMSPDHGASGAIKTSMASRKERLMFYITTAGYNMAGPCYQELRKVGVQVLEGTVIKDNYLPIIYEMDEGDDWKEEKNWKKCNPNLDVTVTRDFLREAVSDAITYGGTREVEIKTLNFNMWVNSPSVFIPSEVWDLNYYGSTIERGELCFGGLEVGPSGEISALALLFPGDIIKIKMLWMIAEKGLEQNDFYRDNKHIIKVDPGTDLENEVAVDWIIEELEKYDIQSICFGNQQKQNGVVQLLIKRGYKCNPIAQTGNDILEPTDFWEKKLRAAKFDHLNDPILKMHNSNCLAIKKEKGTRIEKSPKVSGTYACLSAVAQWQTVLGEPSTEIGILYI